MAVTHMAASRMHRQGTLRIVIFQAFSLCSARITGVSSRDSRPVAAAIRPVSRVAVEHRREDLQFWWEGEVRCIFPPKLEILVGGMTAGPGETPPAGGGLAAVLLAEGRVGRGAAGRTPGAGRDAAGARRDPSRRRWVASVLLAEGRVGRGAAGRTPGAGRGAAGAFIKPKSEWRWSPSNRPVLPKPD
jgi:hypothetical protein